MQTISISILTFSLLLLSSSVIADAPDGAAYLDGGTSKTALILVHGRGKHPTWLVVDPLRKGVHAQLGYHTLSLQMPNADKNWKEYAADFPIAYTSIQDGIRFLQAEKGVTRIYLMGHSMGSRMVSAFMSEYPDQSLEGLILVGCRNNGGHPFACDDNLQNVDIPVLDIWGGADSKDADAASKRKDMASVKFQQVEIPGANHKFQGHEDELVDTVVNWLKVRYAMRTTPDT